MNNYADYETVEHNVTKESYPEFDCADCGVNTLFENEYYMIHNHLWKKVSNNRKGLGMLCIGCVEARLGRLLNFYDFTDAPINSIEWNRKSERLENRLKSIV